MLRPWARRPVASWRHRPHNSPVSYRIGIINVTGYAGMEAARLLWNHPQREVAAVTGRSLAGQRLGDAFPHLAVYGDLTITAEIDTERRRRLLGPADRGKREGLCAVRARGRQGRRHRRRLPAEGARRIRTVDGRRPTPPRAGAPGRGSLRAARTEPRAPSLQPGWSPTRAATRRHPSSPSRRQSRPGSSPTPSSSMPSPESPARAAAAAEASATAKSTRTSRPTRSPTTTTSPRSSRSLATCVKAPRPGSPSSRTWCR